jgi:hypothetical protein
MGFKKFGRKAVYYGKKGLGIVLGSKILKHGIRHFLPEPYKRPFEVSHDFIRNYLDSKGYIDKTEGRLLNIMFKQARNKVNLKKYYQQPINPIIPMPAITNEKPKKKYERKVDKTSRTGRNKAEEINNFRAPIIPSKNDSVDIHIEENV